MPSESIRATTRVAVEPEAFPAVTPPPASPWPGKSIMVRHHSDDCVSASCRGILAIGPNETAALRELARLIKEADQMAAAKGTDPELPVGWV